jgi:Raf kinase inhibitor-like YbhB/YbcL family protein
MQLRSNAFVDGSAVPRRFTCDGEDLSPSLDWTAAPATARSFVLLCDDPDAPTGKWHHWAAYDIARDQTGLAEGAGRNGGDAARFKQAINDFRRPGYGGPCPPRGHGQHHYHFRLLALSVDHLTLHAKPSCSEVEREARKHVVAEATLIGVYQR